MTSGAAHLAAGNEDEGPSSTMRVSAIFSGHGLCTRRALIRTNFPETVKAGYEAA